MEKLGRHALSKVFPSLGMSELESLTKSIASEGLLNSITKYQGKILDGWNRYNACISAGVKPRIVDLPKGADPVLFVIAQNLERRHLATHQKMKLTKRLIPHEQKLAKDRALAGQSFGGSKRQGGTPPPRGGKVPFDKGTAAAKVAKAVGVSARQVERSIAIDKKASPSIRKAVDKGAMSLKEAEQVSKLPKRSQERLASMSKKERASEREDKEPFALGVVRRAWIGADSKTRKLIRKWILKQ